MNINDLKGKFEAIAKRDGTKPNNDMVAKVMDTKPEPVDMARFQAARDEFNNLWFD